MDAVQLILVDKIERDERQPRKDFDERDLEELAESITSVGLLQPIVVRKVIGKHQEWYKLIAGERRLRAVQSLGRNEIPCIVRDISDSLARKLQMAENVVRKNLNHLEIAHGYESLMDDGMTLKEVSEVVGKPPSTISWYLGMLRCRDDVLHLLGRGQITPNLTAQLARLSHNGQMLALRKIQSSDVNGYGSQLICEQVYMQENQADAFPETIISEHQQRVTRQVKDAFEKMGAAVAALQLEEGKMASSVGDAVAPELDLILQKIQGLRKNLNWLERAVIQRRVSLL